MGDDLKDEQPWAEQQSPPPPPPRDINPFGQPATPGNDGGDSFSSVEPPRPSTPPPPVPSKGTTEETAATAANSDVGEGVDTPLPPRSPPPPLPGSGGEGGIFAIAGAVAEVALSGRGRGARRKALDDTRVFEQRRHKHFGEKYDGDSLYWKCFVELIRRSQANNRRAVSYATQKLSATHAYARSLYAIRDRVDGLEPGTTEGIREKERKKKGEKHWPPQQQPLEASPKHQQEQRSHASGANGEERPRPASALDCLLEMEEYAAMRTIDMCQEAHVKVIDKQLNAMVKKLDDRFAEMVGQGTACLRMMNSAETNSASAYARYQGVVTASLEREAAPEGKGSSLVLRGKSYVTASDVWLADMNYRVAVTQQARVWKGVSAKLGDLFGRMKDIEVERRKAIQGGLTALVQLQDALWRDLPMLKDPVLFTLNRINVDRHLLDQEVRQQMRVGAARMLAGSVPSLCETCWAELSPLARSGSAEKSDSAHLLTLPNSTFFMRTPGGFSHGTNRPHLLESPLASPLIARSTMLERREKVMIASRWTLVLAILTHDSYLLLFDMPKGSAAHKKQLSARTTEAFSELVPKPEVGAMAVELGKHKDGKGIDSGGLPVPPSVAIDLSACQVNFKPDGKSDATFEITEIKPTRGVKTVFKNFEETKFTLRGRSQEAMVDWVCEIKEMGRAGMQAVSDSGKDK
ncbi:unnamed protein product [Scytosiphon promiscuus]